MTDPTPTPPEFPKPLVKLKIVVGGYDAVVTMVADADAETVAKAEGYVEVPVPTQPDPFAEYPKWKYATTGGDRRIVQTQAEVDALTGYADTPPEPPPAA